MGIRKSLEPLAKGQLWKTASGFVYIVELKRLAHFKMMKRREQKLVRTQISAIGELESYLKANAARLVADPV